jgi:uncharacterized protein
MSTFESRKKAASIRQKQIEEKGFSFTEEDGPPRFVADVMLGRLAKWLRIAGFDVLYSNTYSDNELVRISNDDARILLSRDTRLLVRKEVRRFVFLESQELQEQIRQLFGDMHLEDISSPLTRCISCNEALQDAARESVRTLVPAFVFDTQERFKACPACGKVFWAGTHRASVVRILEKLGRDKHSA